MNRNWIQVFVGASALTGAFFFGSVMQRRHGDLEKKTQPQPMLENEDLVWQTTPSLPSGQSDRQPPPMVTSPDSTGENPNTKAIIPPNRSATSNSHSDSTSVESRETFGKKVVQPDFSRWSESAQTEIDFGSTAQASPMLSSGKAPKLLENPAQPSGSLQPLPERVPEQASPWNTGPTAEHDPWTAPLSSVLLKPPAANPAQPSTALPGNSAPTTAAINDSRAETSPAPMLPAPVPPKASSTVPQPESASGALVPVAPQGKGKIEIDTDSFRIHVVRAGDTLQSIAARYYGKADFYLDIYLANQDQLTSPINLPAGKALKIPDYSK